MRTKLPSSAARSTSCPDVRLGELLAEVEPEVRELERHVDAQAFGLDALEDPQVLVHDGQGRGLVENVLAEERRVRVEAFLVEAAQHLDARVERLARDEARGAEAHPVAVGDPLDGPALGRPQDDLAQAGVDRAPDAAAQRGRFPSATSVSRAASTPRGT